MKTDDPIPRGVALLWKREREQQPAARRQALSRERIVAAAIAIADAEGLSALSMARLAARLGSAPMSLYRHVANKEELELFMMDTAPGRAPEFKGPAARWRGGLERWARALRAVYYRHPWILQVTTGRPPLEPGQLAWLDAGLRTLAGTRLAPKDRLSVILLVLNYVRGEAQIAIGLLQANRRTKHEERALQAWYGRVLAQLVDAERFPALAEVSAAGVFAAGDDGADRDFEFGLARLLDGVGARVRARS